MGWREDRLTQLTACRLEAQPGHRLQAGAVPERHQTVSTALRINDHVVHYFMM